MCNFCQVSKNSTYISLIDRMTDQDIDRMGFSAAMAEQLPVIKNTCFASLKWPQKFYKPMFEARTAFAVPNNYFQNLLIDGNRTSVRFSHGSMRSIFFVGNQLMLLSKNVNFQDGREYFTSYVFCHFDNNEYQFSVTDEGISIQSNTTKSVKNLITNKIEKKTISFNFVGKSVINKIVTKDRVKTSAQFMNVYSRYGGFDSKAQSIDLEGYAITVPHISPHPYLLELHDKLGFPSKRDIQEHVIDYFSQHANK